jgi:hypothetical protein
MKRNNKKNNGFFAKIANFREKLRNRAALREAQISYSRAKRPEISRNVIMKMRKK